MTDEIRQTAAVLPAPRHLRKRRLRAEIPASQMLGATAQARLLPAVRAKGQADGRAILAVAQPVTGQTPKAQHDDYTVSAEEAALQRKRRIALAIVILVSVTIPVLALTLIFGQ
ncbi:hypothetical protein AAHB34_16790 [Paenarthrobacter ureafaciens]